MSKQISFAEAAEILKKYDKYLILTHAHPDGDTLGSGFGLCSALRQIGKNANVIGCDEIPNKFGYLTVEGSEDFEPETVISVDVADERLLGSLQDIYADKVLLAIDHHSTNTGFAENLYSEGDSAAAAECTFRVIKELGARITPFIASCLYTGIATDTGCFKFSNTTSSINTIADTNNTIAITAVVLLTSCFMVGQLTLFNSALNSLKKFFFSFFSVFTVFFSVVFATFFSLFSLFTSLAILTPPNRFNYFVSL